MKELRTVRPYPFPYSWRSVKPPVAYYGGKQLMWTEIKKLIPEHIVRYEPFVGGATSLILPPAKVEIWNDINGFVVNFYETAKRFPKELEFAVQDCLVSQMQFRKARETYKKYAIVPKVKDVMVECARAFFILCNLSICTCIGTNMQIKRDKNSTINNIISKKERIYEFCKRVEKVQILSEDATKIISKADSSDGWMYVDPPYIDADQGHYKGYSVSDFENLLNLLGETNSLFLLSCYPSSMLNRYVANNGWNYDEHIKIKRAPFGDKKPTKIECLVWNYNLHDPQKKLF